MLPSALATGDVFWLVLVVAIPLAAIAFAASGPALKELGKGGPFSIAHDFESRPEPGASVPVSAAVREAEIRQFLEAKAWRQSERGEEPIDVAAETARLMRERPKPNLSRDKALVSEVRELVIAANARRARRGEEPLDVEPEVQRKLRELENLGQ